LTPKGQKETHESIFKFVENHRADMIDDLLTIYNRNGLFENILLKYQIAVEIASPIPEFNFYQNMFEPINPIDMANRVRINFRFIFY